MLLSNRIIVGKTLSTCSSTFENLSFLVLKTFFLFFSCCSLVFRRLEPLCHVASRASSTTDYGIATTDYGFTTIDYGCCDYTLRLLRLQIAAVIHRPHTWVWRVLTTTDSGCRLILLAWMRFLVVRFQAIFRSELTIDPIIFSNSTQAIDLYSFFYSLLSFLISARFIH